MPAKIAWFDYIVIAARRIPLGAVVQKSTVRIARQNVTYVQANYLQEFGQILGMRARRDLRAGQVIELAALMRPNIVRFGEVLRVQVQQGRFSLSVNARARAHGALGDVIPVVIERSKKKVMAKIIGKGKVVIQ